MSEDVVQAQRVIGVEEHAPLRRPTSESHADARGLGGADSRGSFAGPGGVRAFVDSAPLDEQGLAKLGHLNAERILDLKTA